MKPASKEKPINDLLSAIAGKDRNATISAGGCMCPFPSKDCHKDQAEIKLASDIDRREYAISGFCSACQNATFGDE